MRYYQGNFILSDEDRELLGFTTMNQIEVQYQATYFIGSMLEIKSQAADTLQKIVLKQQADARDSAKMGLLHQILEVCDLMIVRGHEAAGAEYCVIQMH
ncbi:MAG: hypothetical protein WC710_08110 [Gallionella sp.]|jgi:hypothetical protein